VIDLMKRWPTTQNRREVLMVTDGIDRARRSMGWHGLYTNPDVDSANQVAMRTGTMIHTIYAPGVGRLLRNYWEATNGQMGIAKLSDVTGGESFFLGLQQPVSFAPYLDQLQRILNNQYPTHSLGRKRNFGMCLSIPKSQGSIFLLPMRCWYRVAIER
jgi:hypothetical protein